MKLVSDEDKTVNTSISFTRKEKEYLDKLAKNTGMNRHEILSALLKLHKEGSMVLLKAEREKDEIFKEYHVLKEAYLSTDNNLTDAKLKIEELEKENKELKAAVSLPSSLNDVDVKEKEKPKSFFKRLGGI
jgi:outer membrane PBP1 activator LpoA protein